MTWRSKDDLRRRMEQARARSLAREQTRWQRLILRAKPKPLKLKRIGAIGRMDAERMPWPADYSELRITTSSSTGG